MSTPHHASNTPDPLSIFIVSIIVLIALSVWNDVEKAARTPATNISQDGCVLGHACESVGQTCTVLKHYRYVRTVTCRTQPNGANAVWEPLGSAEPR